MTGIENLALSAAGVEPVNGAPFAVLAWILTFPDRVMVLAENGDFLGRFETEENVLQFMAKGANAERERICLRKFKLTDTPND